LKCRPAKRLIGWQKLVDGFAGLLEEARLNSARSVNSIITSTIGKQAAGLSNTGKKGASKRLTVKVYSTGFPKTSPHVCAVASHVATFSHAAVLSLLATNCADTVCTIRLCLTLVALRPLSRGPKPRSAHVL
jgi:hypothetical protein